jgi:hypothetical protein
MNVKQLIKELQKYEEKTEVCSGYLTSNGGMIHADLIIQESHVIGDRDVEGELLLWIGWKE